MSNVKDLIEKAADMMSLAADMMSLGYTDHEIVRILRVPPSMAVDLLEAAEGWNYAVDMENRNSSESYTEETINDMASFYGED